MSPTAIIPHSYAPCKRSIFHLYPPHLLCIRTSTLNSNVSSTFNSTSKYFIGRIIMRQPPSIPLHTHFFSEFHDHQLISKFLLREHVKHWNAQYFVNETINISQKNAGRKADSTLRSSQAVPHPSTDRALRCLTSEVERDPVHSTRYGRRRQKRKIPKQPPSFLPSPILPDPPHRSRHRTELDAEVANSQGRAFRLSCRAGLAGAQTSSQTARHQK